MRIKKPDTLKVVIIAVAAVVVVGVGVFLVLRASNGAQNNDEISVNSETAAKIDPTNYEIDEATKEDLNKQAMELLNSEEGVAAVYKFFDDKINGYLFMNDTSNACVMLWVEYDFLEMYASVEDALGALLRFDDSKLVKYQKIFLYRHIVSASVAACDSETEMEYTALVQELDTVDVEAADVIEDEVFEAETEEVVESEMPAEEDIE